MTSHHYEGRFYLNPLFHSCFLYSEQMNNIERAYPNTNHDTITLSNLKSKFTATVPEGMTSPAKLDAQHHPGFQLWQRL